MFNESGAPDTRGTDMNMPSTTWGYGLDFNEIDENPDYVGVNQGKKRGVTKSAKPKKRRNR